MASVLVISENSRILTSNAAPTAIAASCRTPRSRSDSLFRAALTVSSSPRTGTFMPATVSSNSRLQALRPVTSFSCSSRSSSSDSSCGRNTRRSRNQGDQRASTGSINLASSDASSMRFSSSDRKMRCELMLVTRSLAI